MKKILTCLVAFSLLASCTKEEPVIEESSSKKEVVKTNSNFKLPALGESSNVPFLDDAVSSQYSFSNAPIFKETFSGGTLDFTKWSFVENDKGWNGGYMIRWNKNITWNAAKTQIGFKTDYVNTTKRKEVQCGAISTIGKRDIKYGYFEAYMNMPEPKKHWGAFWLMPGKGHENSMTGVTTANGGSDGAEIDIAEGNNIETYACGIHIDGYRDEITSHQSSDFITGKSKISGNWHVYGVLWTSTEIKYFIDGLLKYTVSKKDKSSVDYWIPDVAQCIRLNSDARPVATATSGGKPWLGGVWSETNNRGIVWVDWVKVFKIN